MVVGGGINGAVSALALAAHGLKVALIDSDDFASGVSQESSNLIWGGFKYLQSYDVALVAGLCRSRNRLARAYESRVLEARFVAALGPTSPYSPSYAALGAHAYWALGGFATQRPRRLGRRSLVHSEPVVEINGVRGAVEYSDYLLADCDARFVLQFVLDAIECGAVAISRLRLDGAERAGDAWRAHVTDRLDGSGYTINTKMLINAAGPRAADVAGLTNTRLDRHLRFSKGAHIVVPRVSDSGRVLAFFDDDQRLFYVIPLGHRSLIGTTDTHVVDADATISDQDRDYLLEQANARLSLDVPLTPADVIAERCGVRPLVVESASDEARDWMELSRRHAVETDETKQVVSILGGKLSDCLNVGEEVVAAARVCGLQPARNSRRWFGEPTGLERERFETAATDVGLSPERMATLWRRHGRRACEVLALVQQDADLGEPLSEVVDFSAAEVQVMGCHEQILMMQDFLRRRTMLALLEHSRTLDTDPGVARAQQLLRVPAAMPTGR